MAKWGEGDPRWIVEERPDATNVNNWHWTEKNATLWSKDRLKSIFQDFVISDNNIECCVSEVEKLEGEATANNRKGKLIFFYEWSIVLKWSGRLPGETDLQEGKITIPNLSEENDLDDIEITITINESNVASEKLKLFMYNYGRDEIRKLLGVYVKELKEEYSKGLILPKKDEKQKIKPDGVSTITSGFNKKINMDKIVVGVQGSSAYNETVPLGYKLECKTLKAQVKFQCRANELYDALTKIEMATAFTRGQVKLEPNKGGEFVFFGGNVHGKFDELIPNEKITQTWRLKQWPAGHYSDVTLDFEEKGDHTELLLTQKGVPVSEFDATRSNWERYYWNSIKQTFGFGSFLV